MDMCRYFQGPSWLRFRQFITVVRTTFLVHHSVSNRFHYVHRRCRSVGSKISMLAGAHSLTHARNFEFTSSTDLAQGQKEIIASLTATPSLRFPLDTQSVP